MNDVFLRQYDSLPKKLQKEVQGYVEYLFPKQKNLKAAYRIRLLKK